jgi:glycosyltransferase involved in cell wall biosynthesis
MINFVVPSLGRKTLKRALNSLIDQNDKNWECWVGFDGLDKSSVDKDLLIDDDRIHYIYIKEKVGLFAYNSGVGKNIGNAGLVRNFIISQIKNDYEWVGFLDDDDAVTPDYIDKLKEEVSHTSFDCCIFRMISGQTIIPPIGLNQVIQNYVGISFCVRKKFLENNNVKFVNSSSEDYLMLKSIHDANGEIYMSEHITYNVFGSDER